MCTLSDIPRELLQNQQFGAVVEFPRVQPGDWQGIARVSLPVDFARPWSVMLAEQVRVAGVNVAQVQVQVTYGMADVGVFHQFVADYPDVGATWAIPGSSFLEVAVRSFITTAQPDRIRCAAHIAPAADRAGAAPMLRETQAANAGVERTFVLEAKCWRVSINAQAVPSAQPLLRARFNGVSFGGPEFTLAATANRNAPQNPLVLDVPPFATQVLVRNDAALPVTLEVIQYLQP